MEPVRIFVGAVPFERHAVLDFVFPHETQVIHQHLIVILTAIQSIDDAVDLPVETAAIKQHDGTLLPSERGCADFPRGQLLIFHFFLNHHLGPVERKLP